MFVFALLSTGIYQVMIAQTKSLDTARATSRAGEEARVGFNRMVRDTREADVISAATVGSSFTIKVNYNADGLYSNPNPNGDNEILTYAYDSANKTVTLNGEILMEGVMPVTGKPMFQFTSNALEYDWDGDGTTTWEEVDQASCASHGITGVGDCDPPPGVLDAPEFPHLTGVEFAIRDVQDTTTFYATAQLRNRV
jgi:hypothetical protein